MLSAVLAAAIWTAGVPLLVYALLSRHPLVQPPPQVPAPKLRPEDLEFSATQPMVNRTGFLSRGERCRVALACVALVPARLALALAALLVGELFAALAIAGWRGGCRPLPGWRRALRWPAVLSLRVALWSAGFLWVAVDGAAVADAPVVVCNHRSVYEPLFLAYYLRGDAAAVASGKGEGPALGRALQTIYVHRERADSRAAAALQLQARVAAGGRALVFPEGCTGNGRAVLRFKAGAFAAGAPVQPVVVRFPGDDRFDPSFVRDGPSQAMLALRLMSRVYTPMRVTFLPVVPPPQGSSSSLADFAQTVRADMAAALGVGVTEHSFDDVQLMIRAKRLGLPPRVAAVEFARIRAARGVDVAWGLEALSRYATAAGRANREAFRDYLVRQSSSAAAPPAAPGSG